MNGSGPRYGGIIRLRASGDYSDFLALLFAAQLNSKLTTQVYTWLTLRHDEAAADPLPTVG